jgi:fructoselysine 6-kinase
VSTTEPARTGPAGPVIAAVGDNTIDEYTGGQAGSYVGGNALNVAVNCVRLGVTAEYFGAVGPDPRGDRVRDTLQRQGVGTGGLVVLDGVTSVSVIRVDETGDRHFEHEDFGVCARYAPGEEDLRRLARVSAVHIGLLPHPAPLREWLHACGVLVSQDCAVTAGYEHLDIAFCSAAAATGDPADIARRAVAGGARLCVVTCGADGSVGYDSRTWWRMPALGVRAVDTTGAGDSYIAGFLRARLAGADVPQAMAAGTASAALTCTHQGAWLPAPAPLPVTR